MGKIERLHVTDAPSTSTNLAGASLRASDRRTERRQVQRVRRGRHAGRVEGSQTLGKPPVTGTINLVAPSDTVSTVETLNAIATARRA
jgi:hypothetical protein